MFIAQVFIHVKEEYINNFIEATVENAKNSLKESGVVRFDFAQQTDDPTRFVLVEIYKTSADPAKHKETEHYKKWRDTVADMMAKPRTALKYKNIYPTNENWS